MPLKRKRLASSQNTFAESSLNPYFRTPLKDSSSEACSSVCQPVPLHGRKQTLCEGKASSKLAKSLQLHILIFNEPESIDVRNETPLLNTELSCWASQRILSST